MGPIHRLLAWAVGAYLALPSVSLVPIPAEDFAWLNATTVDFLVRCQLAGVNGTRIFTPDASSSYGEQWTRDFAMAVLNAPDALKAAEASSGASVAAAVAFTFERIEPSGMAPDRVTSGGEAVFAPGTGTWPVLLAWDNMPFAGLLLAGYAEAWGNGAEVFCAWEGTARRAIDFVPMRDGLAFNDPAAPNCSYGFEDSVVLPGRMLTVSLLMFDAATRLSALATATGCGDPAHYDAVAAGVAVAVDGLFDAPSGLFLAADATLAPQPDVFGSAYAVVLGLGTQQHRTSVGAFLAAQWRSGAGSVWQQGQARHLPQPLFWAQCWDATCPAKGTYQNGAFWATPLNWVLPALVASGFGREAQAAAAAAVASFRAFGVNEAVNSAVDYVGVTDYIASATNVLGALKPIGEPWRHEPMGSVEPPVETLEEASWDEPVASTQRAGRRSLLGCKWDNFHHKMSCSETGQPSAPPKAAVTAAAVAAAPAVKGAAVELVHVIGERNSGTNWLETVLRANFAPPVWDSFCSFKHWAQEPCHPKQRYITVVLFRNPYDW